jgi:nucleoside-diphosphate-sugar epimerase
MEKNSRLGILGCGWLGKELAIGLVKDGFLVKGSTTREEKLSELQGLGIESFAFRLNQLTKESIDFFKVDTLIIAITSKDIHGYMHLVKIIEASPISRVIFISSTSVYGKVDGEHTEESPVIKSPLSEIEKVFIASTVPTTIVRFGGLVGYDRQPGKFFSGRTIPNPGGVVNLIHRDDCLLAIRTLLDKGITNEIFNVCASEHPQRGEFYQQATADLGLDPAKITPTEDTVTSMVNSDKLEAHTGLRFDLRIN